MGFGGNRMKRGTIEEKLLNIGIPANLRGFKYKT